MKEWLYIVLFMVSGWLVGLVFRHADSLIRYIARMDDEHACDGCGQKTECAALRPIGASNWVTEFTYTAFWLVYKKCGYVERKAGKSCWLLLVLNGILYLPLAAIYGVSIEGISFCLCTTALLYIGIVDWNTQYIPVEFNCFIFILGLIRLIIQPEDWLERVIGLFAISLFLLLIDRIGAKLRDGGHVVGGGDIKLMAAAGLLLGWKLNLVAFMLGCICGSVIHLIIMKVRKDGHQLAFGPYLAMGVYIAMICGEQLISWYLSIMGL